MLSPDGPRQRGQSSARLSATPIKHASTNVAAVAAARDDPRFPPVSGDELGAVRIAIAVLTEPARLHPVLEEAIAIGRDGLLVRRRGASGLLLPQVASEQRWGPEAFLAAACRKALARASRTAAPVSFVAGVATPARPAFARRTAARCR